MFNLQKSQKGNSNIIYMGQKGYTYLTNYTGRIYIIILIINIITPYVVEEFLYFWLCIRPNTVRSFYGLRF